MIRHKFTLVVDGVQYLKPVDFKSISDLFQNIELINTSGFDFELTIVKRRTIDIETSIIEAKNEADQFADKLALIENHNIILLKYLGYLDEKNNLVSEKNNVVVNVGLSALIDDPTKYYTVLIRKNIFESTANLGLKRAFRTTLSITDPISKYLMFYGILYVLCDEKQLKVDDYIKKRIPNIQIIPGNGTFTPQTIITWIRNRIAHPDGKMDLDEITNNSGRYIETLKDLVLEKLRK